MASNVQCYNPATNATTEYTGDSFPGAPRLVGGQAAINNLLYVLGGFDAVGMFDDTWVFDPSQPVGSRWTDLGVTLNSQRSYIATAVIGDLIYAIGGDTFEGGGLVPQAVTEVLDTTDIPSGWQDGLMADLPAGSEAGDWPGTYVDGPYALSGYIYTTGGYWPTPGPYDYFFQYDPIADTWDVNLPALNTTRRNHAMSFVPSLGGHPPRLWVFGGYDGSGTNAMTDSTEYFEVEPVALDPPEQTTDGAPCAWVDSTLTLINNIGFEETFDVTYLDYTWEVQGPASVGPVADGASLDFTVSVSVPCDAGCFEEDTVLVEVEAQSAPIYTDSATITTRSGGAWVEQPNAGSVGGYYMMGTCTDDYGAAGTCFYFGGRDYTPPTGQPTSYSQMYDIDSQTWTQIADMPTARYAGLAGWIDGKAYVVGGDIDADVIAPTDALEIYDPATNTWDTTGAPLPMALTGMAGAVINDKLYVAGGTDGVYVYATLYEYDPTTDTWTQLANMPGYYPYYGAGAAVDGRLYVGGSIGGDVTFLSYDPTNDQWTQKANIPSAAGQFIPKAEGAFGHIFWWGGTISDFGAPMLDTTWVYDPVLNVWSQSSATLNTATAGHAGGWANGLLWSFAGPFQNPHEATLPCVPPPPPLGSIEGYIYDANYPAEGIYGTYIYIEKADDEDTWYETYSEETGYYDFTGVLTGTYIFREIGAIGYDPIFTGTVEVGEGEVAVMNFWLNASMVEVDPASLSEMAPVGDQVQATVTLSNPGTADLLFHVEEIGPDSPFPVPETALIPPAPQRVDPQVYQEMAASPDGTTKFLIVMAEQADLSAAYAISDWEARGQYVYNTLKATAERSQAALRRDLAAQGVGFSPVLVNNGLWVTAGSQVLDSVLARADVAYVMANRLMETLPMESEPVSPDAFYWNIELARANEVWGAGYDGAGVVVANIDTGVWYTHDALRRQYRGYDAGSYDHDYNWYHPTTPAGCDGSEHPCDNDGHGTSTMGIMAGETEDLSEQIGMAPGAQWIACKGCEANSCSSEALLGCADWMLAPTRLDGTDPDPAMRPHVINNSWGGSSEDGWYFPAVAAWRASGMFPAFANGNDGPACGTAHSPGDYYNSFSSGAIYYAGPDNYQIASYSSRGPTLHYDLLKPNVAAPADPVRTSTTNGDSAYTNSFNGTSSASPHTAGEVALIWSAQPELIGQIEMTEWLIEQTAVPVFDDQCDPDGNAPNNVWGWGIIDAYQAVTEAIQADWGISWLDVDPTGGSVAPGETGDLLVTFDATDLEVGMCYNATLKIETNSPYASEWPTMSLDVFVPVELCATCTELASAVVEGPAELMVGETGTYSVTWEPEDATPPVEIEWSNGMTGTSTIYSWDEPGTYTVVVTATNCDGTAVVTDSLEVTVLQPMHYVYLPIVVKNH
jgi:subtilisin family serine protease/N-acetylneuraminic acid mutarotase